MFKNGSSHCSCLLFVKKAWFLWAPATQPSSEAKQLEKEVSELESERTKLKLRPFSSAMVIFVEG
jgi:hypothetical protein